jgi:hypothetical protein
MSPEQARGKAVDKRADIWAFGCVLYEMLTGQPAFSGETTTDILGEVVTKNPDLARAPAEVRRLLTMCLAKDPKKRLRDIGDWRLLVEDSAPPASLAPLSSRFRNAAWAVAAGAFALIAAGVSFVHFREKPPEQRVERFSLAAPEGADFSNLSRLPAISPDGRHVAFSTTAGLWVRDLDALNARMLTSAPDTIYPFWSPDSQWIGFFTQSKLEKIAVGGGPPMTICDAPIARGGTWSEKGIIVYALANTGLFRVPVAGGTPESLTKVDDASGHVSDRLPWFLPDGRRFLYTARNNDPEKTRVYVGSIDARPGSQTGKAVLTAASNVVYLPPVPPSQGYLLFVRDHTLMAQPFDPSKAQTTGDPVNVAEEVDFLTAVSQGQFSASQNGTLVYTSGAVGQNKQLTWFDRSGTRSAQLALPRTQP